jgi:arginase family enzyme
MNIVDAHVDSLASGMNTVVGLPYDNLLSLPRRPVYRPRDLDLLDPTLAPGASPHEAGWLFAPDVIWLIRNLRAPTGGIDIVECDPRQDLPAISARAASLALMSR